MMEKKKVLMLSDHPMSTSGVGIQARYLIDGLLKTGRYTFRCIGGAKKHDDYRLMKVTDDFLVLPIDGYGTPDLLRSILAKERPDVLLLFTDPRFFVWVFEMEDEIHQVCPIAYNTIWDNDPVPDFNGVLYESCDLLNCISKKTFDLINPTFPAISNHIPHGLPKDIFYPLEDDVALRHRLSVIGHQYHDHFILLWVNRNARRKMPGSLLDAWAEFLKVLEQKYGHRKALLVMHTDPLDEEGPNLFSVVEMLGIRQHVKFSTQRLDFEQMNILHNISDACIQISSNEGFGLSTLESMQCGKPIIALKTGGLTDQVANEGDGSVNGIALEPDVRSLVGSQLVPYIYEDLVSREKIVDGIMALFEMGEARRKEIGMRARNYVLDRFDLEKIIEKWDTSLTDLFERWEGGSYRPWELIDV